MRKLFSNLRIRLMKRLFYIKVLLTLDEMNKDDNKD